MEIRTVRPEEYEEAGRVTMLAYQEFVPPDDDDWERYVEEIGDIEGRAPRMPVLVAVEDGRILGTATLEHDDRLVGDDDESLPADVASLRMLGVDPAARGRGVGRALVEACIRRSREMGKRVFVLRTTPVMETAQRMYEGMGFRRDPDRDLVFDDRLRLIAYRLEI